MSATVWIRHTVTGGEAEVPEAALPIYRQSGWDLMPSRAVAELKRAADAELAAEEQAMRSAAAGGALTPPADPEAPATNAAPAAPAAGPAASSEALTKKENV